MDRKRNARVLAFVYGGYLMRYLYLLVVIPFYGRVLGVTEYGRVLAAMSLMNVIWMLVSYGFTFAGVRDIAKTQQRGELNAIFSQQTSARVAMAALGGVVGLIATQCSPLLAARPLIGVLATLLGIVSGANLGWLFQGRQYFRTPIVLEVLGFSLSLVLVLSLVRGPLDSVWVLASLLIAGVVSSSVAYGLAIRDLGAPRLSAHGVCALLRSSTLLFCYSTGSVLLTASSTYLLSLLSSPAEVGYFGAAERFASIGLSLMGPAGQVFVPTIARLIAQGDQQGAAHATQHGATLLLGYGLLALCGALILSPLLMPLILGAAFAPSAHVLQCLAWMFPFAAFNQFVAFYVLVPRRMDRLLAIAGLAGALVNLAASLYLAPRYGALGMAFGRVAGEAALSLALLTVVLRAGLMGYLPNPATAFAGLRFARLKRGENR